MGLGGCGGLGPGGCEEREAGSKTGAPACTHARTHAHALGAQQALSGGGGVARSAAAPPCITLAATGRGEPASILPRRAGAGAAGAGAAAHGAEEKGKKKDFCKEERLRGRGGRGRGARIWIPGGSGGLGPGGCEEREGESKLAHKSSQHARAQLLASSRRAAGTQRGRRPRAAHRGASAQRSGARRARVPEEPARRAESGRCASRGRCFLVRWRPLRGGAGAPRAARARAGRADLTPRPRRRLPGPRQLRRARESEPKREPAL